jgi:NAD(P)-dependent dehydrogenase (short-subunit alcohol dehydrogenase family)
MSEHAGRVALVTGGSSGIGRGAALRLAAHGSAVAVHGLEQQGAEGVAAEIRVVGGRSIAVSGDLVEAQTADAAVAATVSAFGRLDTLVTAAGIQRYGDALTTSESTWDEVFDVNVKAVFLAVRAAAVQLRASGAGAIAIVASVQGSATQNNVAAYSASKGALHAFARALAVDEARYGVRVNSVSPGSVDTPMLRASAARFSEGSEAAVERVLHEWGTAHALGRIATADEIGEVIAFLTGPRASFIAGADIRVDGGLLARIAAPLPEHA